MRFSTLLLGGVAFMGLSSAAFAADLIVSEPVPSTVLSSGTDWSGLYIGAHVGYGWGDWDYSGVTGADPFTFEGVEPEGAIGGVQIGYNWQVDNVVFGLQADLTLAGIEVENPPGSGEFDSLDAYGTLSGRVGLALGSVLPYVKLGGLVGTATGSYDGQTDNAAVYGWLAGAGLEVAVTDQISAFVEYDYIGIKGDTFEFTGASVDAKGSVQTVKAGLNFKF